MFIIIINSNVFIYFIIASLVLPVLASARCSHASLRIRTVAHFSGQPFMVLISRTILRLLPLQYNQVFVLQVSSGLSTLRYFRLHLISSQCCLSTVAPFSFQSCNSSSGTLSSISSFHSSSLQSDHFTTSDRHGHVTSGLLSSALPRSASLVGRRSHFFFLARFTVYDSSPSGKYTPLSYASGFSPPSLSTTSQSSLAFGNSFVEWFRYLRAFHLHSGYYQ